MTEPFLTLPRIGFWSRSSRRGRVMEKVRVSITRRLMRFQRAVCCWEGEGWSVMLEGDHVVIAACHSCLFIFSLGCCSPHQSGAATYSWARGKHTKLPTSSSGFFLAWNLLGQGDKREIFLRSHDFSVAALISISKPVSCEKMSSVQSFKMPL